MPSDSNPGNADTGTAFPADPDDDFSRAGWRLVRTCRVLLADDDADALLAPMAAWRLQLADVLASPRLGTATGHALRNLHNSADGGEPVRLLINEIYAVSATVATVQAPSVAGSAARPASPAAEERERPRWQRLRGIGKTLVDSFRELLSDRLGPWEKAIWKLVSEGLEMGKI